jgi:hypothetical protein
VTQYLCEVFTTPKAGLTTVSLPELAQMRGIPSSKQRLLERYFGLESVVVSHQDLGPMLFGPLAQLVDANPDLMQSQGLLLYVRTQTHATHAGVDWLTQLAGQVGLGDWDVMVQTQTHCAGGLAAVELLQGMQHPVIVLTGEKCFHPITATQSGAALGEAPAAALFRPDRGRWRVAHVRTRHLPQFHANPDRMSDALRKDWDKGFGAFLEDFLRDTLARVDLGPDQFDLVVPYNLNLPLLTILAQRMGWQDRIYTKTLSWVGHLFCADVYFNLAQVLPDTTARRILCFAAGMGATFSTVILERSDIAMPDDRYPLSGRTLFASDPL